MREETTLLKESTDRAPRTGARISIGLAALVAYFLMVVALQHWRGAAQAPFDGYPDEPSHYVSGLMLRDYVTSGFSRAPVAFAQDFYLHVPYFAVGYWPPLYYLIEAIWMLCFGPGRAAAVLLIALIVALIATLIFAALRSSLGALAAFGFGVLFVLLPLVEANSMLVMTDLPVTLLGFGALLALAAYLSSARLGPLLAFTVLAALTILTKGSGLYLTALLPAALLLTGRLRWILRPSFWIAPVGIALLCAPWYILSRKFLDRGFLGRTDFATGAHVLGWDIVVDLGLLAPLTVWGAWTALRSRPVPPLAVLCVIQPVILIGFLMAAPVIVEPRYMLPALPPLIILSAYGMNALVPRRRVLALTGLLIAVAGVRIYVDSPPRPANDIRPIAEFVVHHSDPMYKGVMVSAEVEGPMIAEIVSLEPHAMDRYLIRPGKLLARMDWLGRNYHSTYDNTGQIQELFDHVPVNLVILRSVLPPSALPHERLLAETVHASPALWRKVFPPVGQSSRYEAYQPVHGAPDANEELQQFLQHQLTPLRSSSLIGKPEN